MIKKEYICAIHADIYSLGNPKGTFRSLLCLQCVVYTAMKITTFKKTVLHQEGCGHSLGLIT